MGNPGSTHHVEISPLWVGVTPVTAAQYQQLTGKHPSAILGEGALPVESVTWYEAAHFCNLLSDRAGLPRCYDETSWACDFARDGFRLPTEAEWEWFCRAGSQTRYFFGESDRDLPTYAWYGNTESGNAADLIRPVRGKRANAWGLFDVVGNTWQWCNDWYGENYYAVSRAKNPAGPAAGTFRVMRGGSFVSNPEYLVSAYRERYLPDLSYLDLGFRVVKNGGQGGPEQPGVGEKAPAAAVEAAEVPITMLTIPGGSFAMGASDSDAMWDEAPVHTVTVSSFRIGRTLVTQQQYAAVMGTHPAHFRGMRNLPVESVTWYDAVRCCDRLSRKEGLTPCYDEATWRCDFTKNGYRLPTEAETEYAVRAGSKTVFWSGNGYADLDRVAWFQGNSGSKTHPVAMKPANPFGLFDAQGDVWVWTNDWYRWDYYTVSPAQDPRGPDYSAAKVARGGGRFYSWSRHARSTRRTAVSPDRVDNGYGFRLAQSLSK